MASKDWLGLGDAINISPLQKLLPEVKVLETGSQLFSLAARKGERRTTKFAGAGSLGPGADGDDPLAAEGAEANLPRLELRRRRGSRGTRFDRVRIRAASGRFGADDGRHLLPDHLGVAEKSVLVVVEGDQLAEVDGAVLRGHFDIVADETEESADLGVDLLLRGRHLRRRYPQDELQPNRYDFADLQATNN